MAEQWNQSGYSLTVRLGHLAIRAQGLLIAQRVQSIQRMLKAHTRDLRQMPGAKRKFKEAQKHIDAVKQIIKDDPRRG
jgi:hypothetical protein